MPATPVNANAACHRSARRRTTNANARRFGLGLLLLLGMLPGHVFGSVVVPCDFIALVDAIAPRLARAPAAAPTGSIAISPDYLPYAYLDEPYSQSLSASGGTAPYTFAVTAGSLPPGFSLSGSGLLAGTTSTDGSFGFTVTATDAGGLVGSRAYTLEVGIVGTIVVSPPSIPSGTLGQPYSRTFSATGGTPPYTFECNGSLPDGMTLDAGGLLSGTPTSAGTYSFTVVAIDATESSGSRSYSLIIEDEPVVLSPATLPGGTVGTPYSQALAATGGGDPPYIFGVTAGALPEGLSLGGTGMIDGTPTAAGDFAFTVTATDATLEHVGSRNYSLGILAPTITVDPPLLADATVGVDYQQTFTASGGNGPYTFAVTAGSLAPGMFLDSDGTLHGAPTEPGDHAFTVTATDNFEQTGERAYVLAVAEAVITLTPATLPDGVVGTAYVQPIAASGGTAPYTFAIASGALPPGMAMDGDGIIDSTPTEAGLYAFTVTATDVHGQVGERAYSLHVQAPVITLEPASLPAGTVGSDYAQLVTASGGNAPYTFAVTAGTIPDGLFLSSDGTLEGAPAEAGSFAFTVTATDNYNQTGERAYVLEVASPVIRLSPTSLPDAVVGGAYAQPIAASGGTAPYSFAIVSGELPAGMEMDGDGVVDGTPAEAGFFNFQVSATDAYGQVGEHAYSLSVVAPLITLDPAALPAGTVGSDYAQVITASGGNGPYGFAVTAGMLPAGLSLSSEGALTGTPKAAGHFAFTVTATDHYDQAGERAYIVEVTAPDIVVSPGGTLPGAVAGTAYHQALTATGGTPPYRFGLGGGALPPGILLSDDGVLSGTPIDTGAFVFDVVATDAYDQPGLASLQIVVEAAEIVIAPTALPAPSVGVPYQLAFEATGGVAPYTFTLAGGALPPGLALDSTGVLAGTPVTAGDFVFTVAANDAIGNGGTRDYLLSLAALPDPTDDPDVTGLVTSQVSTVRTFATTQIGNVHHHLESLHGGGETGWSFWIAGSVRSGDRDGNEEVSPLSFETSGLTGGTDFRPNQQFAFGGGLGYARDRTSVGNDGSRNDGDAPSGVSYMSWHPEDLPLFLDGMGGYQDLEFDVRRSTAGGATFLGRRLGKQRFTSWQGGYEHRTDAFLFSPYGRVDAASARLDGFREQGDDPLALQFGSQAVDLRTTTLGFRMHYRMATDWGEWEPRVRVEYQRDFHEDDGVSIRYANQAASPVFFTTPTGLDEDRFVIELGSLFRTNWHGLLIRVDYLGVYGGANDNEHAVTFSFQED